MNSQSPARPRQKGILGLIERIGNALPDPVFIFVWLIVFLVGVSVWAGMNGWQVEHPIAKAADGSPQLVQAMSLLDAENLRRLFVDMPTTFTHFHPLGYVLVVMLGAGVAERSGFFGAAMRQAVRGAPVFLLTPIVALVGMISSHAADAGYVVLIPLSAALYAAAGRHPIAGIAASFAAVSGGYSANIVPGQLDALLFGITEASATSLEPDWQVNIAGNAFFIIGMTFAFLPVIWFVTDRIIEPRLGPWGGQSPDPGQPAPGSGEETDALTAAQKRGLFFGVFAMLAVVALWVALTVNLGFWPDGDAPLYDEGAEQALTPFYSSLVAGFFVLFLAAGWAYGAAAGTVKGHRDIVRMMTESMETLAYYLVLAFAAAHFVAMFNWSNLGLIFAINGAEWLESSDLPMPALLVLIVLFSGTVNLFVGSASAKWALMAPVLVPMLMLLGVSPEMTTAAYRVGDSATNIITPLMVYFPLILVFAQRYDKEYGLGSLMATMVPYSIWIMIAGLAMTFAWVYLGLPLGPGASVDYQLPGL